MPVTVNAPGFWDLTLDNFINKSERTPRSDGSYTFDRDNSSDDAVAPEQQKQGNLYPATPRWIQRKGGNLNYYDAVMGLMKNEADRGVIPYNGAPIRDNYNPELLDAIRQWIARGGARKFGE